MAIEVTIPRLGWSMDEGTFGEWLKADGEFVEAGEAIFALESEKALQEVESVDSGVLRILPNAPQEGDTVTVGTLVAYLLEEGEQIPAESRGIPAPARAAEPEEQPTPQVNPQAVRVNTPGNESRVVRPTISPRAARLAKQSGVDWTTLTGSGTTGRIRERDVRAAMPSGEKPGRVRRVIAERMMHSVSNSAPVTLTTRVDATKLIRLREHYKTESRDFVPAYQDIIAMQVALTLRAHPEMQFQWGQRRHRSTGWHSHRSCRRYNRGIAGSGHPQLRSVESCRTVPHFTRTDRTRPRGNVRVRRSDRWHVHDHKSRGLRDRRLHSDHQHAADGHSRAGSHSSGSCRSG